MRGEDDKTYEEFLTEQEAEMNHSGDEATLNMSGAKALADIEIFNEAGLDVLTEQVATLASN
jgi:hypothetical protein